MIFFAYDGSVNGDWVAHYASRFAAAHAGHMLNLVHVPTGQMSELALKGKLATIRTECERLGVELVLRILPHSDDVFNSIRSVIPKGPAFYLVCGTRVRGQQRGLLSGTISEQFLRSKQCNVMAVRVVQPGLLGLPHRVMVPLAGHPQSSRSALPFLRLLIPSVSHLQILFVVRVGRWHFRWMTYEEINKRRLPGLIYCRQIEQEMSDQLGLDSKILDSNVRVSDDIPGEILIAANRSKSQLIYMGASERDLPTRFFQGNPIERVLRDATCDVAVYRGIE